MRILLLAISTLAFAQVLPPKATPGALNAQVTQANLKETACASGWTATVRPPASYTTKLKKEQMGALALIGTAKDFEEDHRVPLELGGNPTDPANLWPQPWARPYGAHEKDQLENAVKRDLCKGTLTLEQARNIFLGDFWKEYKKRFEQKTSGHN